MPAVITSYKATLWFPFPKEQEKKELGEGEVICLH